MHIDIFAALFIIVKRWRQSMCTSIGKWIMIIWHIYTIDFYSAVKKDKLMKFAGKRTELDAV